MADWAPVRQPREHDPLTWARRLKLLRSFTRWLQQFEPHTEVPDDAIFGRLPERQAPHIYSEQEIVDLLAAARRLGPAPGLRGVIFETLFGLIACTGLRISEALALRNEDVDLKHAACSLSTRPSSPSHARSPCTPAPSRRCVAIDRRAIWRASLHRPMRRSSSARAGGDGGCRWASARSIASSPSYASSLGWMNRGTHHAPRIHDLRHSFVVQPHHALACTGH